MADLTFIEKTRLEDLLAMRGGYVLDLSNRQFKELVLDSVKKDVDDPVYGENGTSKANRLRTFWRMESNEIVGKVLSDLIDYSGTPKDPNRTELYEVCVGIARRLCARAEAPKRSGPTRIETATQDLGQSLLNFACLKCGRLSDKAFPIGESGQALCPTCIATESSPSKILKEGLVASLEVGALFFNYKLQSPVGSGAWGEVWKALQTDLGRYVALKFPITPDRVTLARFRREAQVGARLSHPNIPHIYALGEDGGRNFIAMEFVDGQSFDEMLWPDPMVAIQALREVARALGHAHKAGIVHRDVKPGNLLMSSSGRPFLTDFGLATLPDASTTLTGTGVFVGTPEFASPEQKRCLNVDSRSDIYSLGATLFNLLTGTIYGGSKPASRPLPKDISPVVDKCLSEEPRNRFQTADELSIALDNIVAGRSSPTPPTLKTTSSLPAPSKARLIAEWKESSSGLPAGYDLRLECDSILSSGGSAVRIELPPVVGLRRVREPGGWHSEPSLDRPRVWIDPPTSERSLTHLGRVCWYKSLTRLISKTGLIRWTLLGGPSDGTSGTVEIDVDRFIPLAGRAALSPSRSLSFEGCKSLADVNFHADGRSVSPVLQKDPISSTVALRSADPQGDAPLYLFFDPLVPLAEIENVSVRLRVSESKHFTIHYWMRTKDGRDLIVTCKHGEQTERKHTEYEWVLPLAMPSSPDSWEDIRRDLRADVARLFPSHDPDAISLRQIAFRGNFWLARLDFPSR